MPDVGDIHVGVAYIGFGGDAEIASGPGVFADAEAGWRVGAFDLTGFGAYVTRHVDAASDAILPTDVEQYHYRVHAFDLGLRATWRGKYTYAGVGVAFENEFENGMVHSSSGDQPINNTDQHVAGELRVGVVVRHIDVSGAISYASMYDEPFGMYRLGVGYRF